MTVFELAADTTLSQNGIYIVTTGGLNRTITLPPLSGTPSTGYDIKVVRIGSGLVYVRPTSGDTFWDGTTQKTIFDNNGAYSVTVGTNGTVWQELGRYKTVA